MKRVRFVRFFPSDWRSGCIGMSLEQEGFYVRVCAFIYDTATKIPLDDSSAAKLLGLHTNAYRKLRDQLVGLEKMLRSDDGYTVARVERELAAAVYAKRSSQRDAGDDTPGESPPDSRGDSPPESPPVFSKNANDFKVPLKSLSLLPISNKEFKQVPSESGSARGQQQEQVVRNLGTDGTEAERTVSDKLLRRAEGFGLPVEEMRRNAEAASVENPNGHFKATCLKKLQARLPGLSADVIHRAWRGEAKPYGTVCDLLIRAEVAP